MGILIDYMFEVSELNAVPLVLNNLESSRKNIVDIVDLDRN